MSRRKPKPGPAPQPGSAPEAAALAGDPGPVVLTLAVNPVTGRATISSNAQAEHDWLLLADVLAAASRHAQAQLLAAAEARGRASGGLA